MSKTSPYDIKIQNVVASVTLDQKINLLNIMKVFRNVEYRPKQFPGLVFRLKKPKTATLIFGSGKMVCTGAKSEKKARSAVKKVVRELKKNGIIMRARMSDNVLFSIYNPRNIRVIILSVFLITLLLIASLTNNNLLFIIDFIVMIIIVVLWIRYQKKSLTPRSPGRVASTTCFPTRAQCNAYVHR